MFDTVCMLEFINKFNGVVSFQSLDQYIDIFYIS